MTVITYRGNQNGKQGYIEITDDTFDNDIYIDIANGEFISAVANRQYEELTHFVNDDSSRAKHHKWLEKKISEIDMEELQQYLNLVLLNNDGGKNNLSASYKFGAFVLAYGKEDILDFDASIFVDTYIYKTLKSEYKYIPEESQDDTFARCCKEADGKIEVPIFLTYKFPEFIDLVTFVIYQMTVQNDTIKTFKNCGKYFYPATRSDALYCDNISPQDSSKTCKEYGKYINYLKKTQTDEAMKLHRQIYNQKRNRALAYKFENRVINDDFNVYKNESNKWRIAVKTGEKTEEEFIEWLKSVKEKKVL